jgi:hypothetical protein
LWNSGRWITSGICWLQDRSLLRHWCEDGPPGTITQNPVGSTMPDFMTGLKPLLFHMFKNWKDQTWWSDSIYLLISMAMSVHNEILNL